MAHKVFFGAIHIIEWFGANERVHTAWDLFNELEPIGIVYKPQLPVYFHREEPRAVRDSPRHRDERVDRNAAHPDAPHRNAWHGRWDWSRRRRRCDMARAHSAVDRVE
jgi:hypothetical protein